jgi:hypothetical protein
VLGSFSGSGKSCSGGGRTLGTTENMETPDIEVSINGGYRDTPKNGWFISWKLLSING